MGRWVGLPSIAAMQANIVALSLLFVASVLVCALNYQSSAAATSVPGAALCRGDLSADLYMCSQWRLGAYPTPGKACSQWFAYAEGAAHGQLSRTEHLLILHFFSVIASADSENNKNHQTREPRVIKRLESKLAENALHTMAQKDMNGRCERVLLCLGRIHQCHVSLLSKAAVQLNTVIPSMRWVVIFFFYIFLVEAWNGSKTLPHT
eukprot:4374979-Amphidinium_carterae.1